MSDTPPKKKSRGQRLARWVAGLVVVLCACAVAAFTLLQSGPVRGAIAARASSIATAAAGMPVTVAEVSGWLPFNVQVGRIDVDDASGRWLEIRGVRVRLSARALLRGTVSLETLSGKKIHVLRAPEMPAADPEAPAMDLGELPALPDWIRLDDAVIDEIVIDTAAGEKPIRLQAHGKYAPGGDAPIVATVDGMGDTQLRASLRGGWTGDHIAVKLSLEDAAFAPQNLSAEGPLTLTADVEGPLRKAAFTLRAGLGGEAAADLKGTISPVMPMSAALEGTVTPAAAWLPEAVRETLAGALDVGLEVSLDAAGKATITRMAVASSGDTISVEGTADVNAPSVAMSYRASVADVYRFGGARTGTAVPLDAEGGVNGTLDALQLTVKANVSGETWAEGATVANLAEGLSAKGDLKVYPAAVSLPPPLDALAKGGADATYDFAMTDSGIRIQSAAVRLDSAQFSAGGTLDWATSGADLEIDAKAGDLGVFSGIAGTTLSGSATASARVQGDTGKTTVQVDATGTDIAVETVRIPSAAVSAALTAGALADLLSGALGVEVEASLPGLELQPGLPRDLKVSTAFSLEDFQRLKVARLNANDGNLQAEAHGDIDLAARQADFSSAVKVADAAVYAKPLGYPYGGKLDAEIRVATAQTPGAINVTATGTAEGLSGLPDEAAALAEGVSSFEGHGQYDGAQVALESFQVSSKALSVSAHGRYGVVDRAVSGTLEVKVAELAALSGLAGRKLAGAGTISAEVTGTLDDFSAAGALASTGLRVEPVRTETARAEFAVEGLPNAPKGTARVALETKGNPLNASAAFAMTGNVLVVDGVEATAGGNTFSAAGTWNLAQGTGSGTLNADAPNLETLRTWVDLPVKGALKADLALAEDSTAIRGSFSAAGLVLPGLTAGKAEGSVDIATPFTRPEGSISLTASEITAGELALTIATLTAEGPADALRVALACDGVYQGATTFAAKASGEADTVARRLEIATLEGRIDATALALDGPATLVAAGDGMSLSPTLLRIGDGQISMAGTASEKAVEAKVEWQAISLAVLELAAEYSIEGSSSGRAALGGTLGAPTLDAEVKLADVRLAGNNGDGVRGIDSALTARIAAGSALVDVAAGIPEGVQVTGEARTPVAWSLSPWQAEAPPGGALSGSVKASGEVSHVVDALGLEGHVLRGMLDVDLTLTGSVDAPRMEGHAALTEGYYENNVSGTILDTLDVMAEAGGDSLTLTRLDATDGEAGTLHAGGKLSLGKSNPFALDAKLENMRLLRRDDATAEVGGAISFAGNNAGAKVSGEVRVGPATITLADQLPGQEVTTVEYRVAGEADAAGEEAAPPEAAPGYPVALDVRCVVGNETVVRARGLRSEWEGELLAKGDVQAPTLKGALRVKTGKLTFLGRDFDLRESTVTFSGRTPPAPALNILAVSEQRGVTARVRLEGELDALNITMESDPPAPRDEVLSMVLFGRKVSEITPLQGLQLARYAALFDKRVSGTGLLGGGSSASVLDRLSFESGSGLKDSSVTAGKDLGENLYLELEQGAGAKGSAVSLEWLFAPNWSLRGKTGSNSEGGAGLFWKKDF